MTPVDIDFKPPQVILTALPLTGTMGHTEAEHAAAVLVRTCEINGDMWQAVGSGQMMDALRFDAKIGREPFASLARNPFFRPWLHDLIVRGFASHEFGLYAFTARGFEAMRRWVRKPRGMPAQEPVTLPGGAM